MEQEANRVIVRRAVHTVTALKRMSMGVAAHQNDLAKQVTQFKADAEAEHLSHDDHILYTHEDTGEAPPTPAKSEGETDGQPRASGSSPTPGPVSPLTPGSVRGLGAPVPAAEPAAVPAAVPSSSSASQKSQEPSSTAHSQDDMTKAMAKAKLRD